MVEDNSNPSGDRFVVFKLHISTYHIRYFAIYVLRGGPFHHQAQAAGVFVPGHAKANLEDPAIQEILRQPTLELPGIGSTDSLGCPTARALKFSPAPTLTDSQQSAPTPMQPDNQLGLSPVPESPYPSPPEPTPPQPTPAEQPVPPAPSHAEGLAEANTGGEDERPQKDGGRQVILEGTMYEDGTYWKKLNCMRNEFYHHFKNIKYVFIYIYIFNIHNII